MVFSSITFLYYFLPILLVLYFLSPKRLHNIILLIFSLIFYYFGEKLYCLFLLLMCFISYICGLLLNKKYKKTILIIGLIINIGFLLYFKYTNFFIENFNIIFNKNISYLNIVLPLGISFFTFQNISYLIDVYRGDTEPQKNFFNYATYITLFPQLVAGPIVRYKDINNELINRKETISMFASGIKEFIIGLGKKVLIADTLYTMCTVLLKTNMSSITYIVVAIGYTLQIYYDFSGYSNMAIGLGKMFGFNFKENFNYPLISSSITEFWRRWHISLSSFFKDYIYIPLGGNRKGAFKHVRNIFIVWFLTGFWHGASWNFILWGIYFFIILLIEKYFLKKYLKNGVLSHIYTFTIIVISFCIFNITNMTELLSFIKSMFGIGVKFINNESIFYIKNYLLLLIISLIGATPFIQNKLKKGKLNKIKNVLEPIYLIVVLILSTASLISSTFNPFIYFRF